VDYKNSLLNQIEIDNPKKESSYLNSFGPAHRFEIPNITQSQFREYLFCFQRLLKNKWWS
jgi:hypothetical protein